MSRASRDRVASLEAVIDEVRSLFHVMKRAAEEIYGQGELSAGRRGVLRSLEQGGPQTVPQLAQIRPVSRQHIQSLVNPLVEEGLVELVENPAHRRSRLVSLTPRGRRLVERMRRQELEVMETLARTFSKKDLETTADTLETLRHRLSEDNP